MARSAKKRGKLARPREAAGLRMYAQARLLVRRLGLARWVDFRWRELLLARRARAPSGWDRESLWMGELDRVEAAQCWSQLQESAGAPPPGGRCFAARVGGQWAACLCALAGPGQLTAADGSCRWELPAGCAWAFAAMAHPLYIGTYPDLIRFVRNRLRAEGLDRFLAQVEYDNRRSRHLHRMLGGAPIGWVASLRLANWAAHLERTHAGYQWRAGRTPVRLPIGDFLPASGAQEIAEAARVGCVAGKDLG